MTGSDRVIGRMVALIVLLFAAGAATRGYLPGVEHRSHRAAAAGPADMIMLSTLLAVSVGAVAVATVHRLRYRRAVASSVGELPATPKPPLGKPPRRVLLIAVAALAAWLLLILVLETLGGGLRIGIPPELFGPHDGVPASPQAPGAPALPTPHSAPSQDGSTGPVVGYLLAAAAALVVLIAVGIVAARPRFAQPAPPPSHPVPVAPRAFTDDETVTRAAELGLTQILDLARGPRDAIIACYAVMERHLAEVPDVAPRDFDTATEVLARAVEHHALAADNASRLVTLFAEARFSPHLMTERHRADAVEILRLVLDELRTSI